MVTDPKVASKYTAGYSQCANEVTRYLGKMEGFSPDLRNRLLSHLAGCMQKVTTSAVNAQTHSIQQAQLPAEQPFGGFQLASPTMIQTLSTTSDSSDCSPQLTSMTSLQTVALPSSQAGVYVNSAQQSAQNLPVLPVQLIPAKLSTGDMVFLLTNAQSMPTVATNILTSPMSIQIPNTSNVTNNMAFSNLTTNTTPLVSSNPASGASTATVAVVPPNVHGCRLSPSSIPTDLSMKSEPIKEREGLSESSVFQPKSDLNVRSPAWNSDEFRCGRTSILSSNVEVQGSAEDENNNRVPDLPLPPMPKEIEETPPVPPEPGPSGTGCMWRPW